MLDIYVIKGDMYRIYYFYRFVGCLNWLKLVMYDWEWSVLWYLLYFGLLLDNWEVLNVNCWILFRCYFRFYFYCLLWIVIWLFLFKEEKMLIILVLRKNFWLVIEFWVIWYDWRVEVKLILEG